MSSLPTKLDPAATAEQTRWFEEEVQPHESALRSWLKTQFPSLPEIDDIVQDSYASLIRAHQAHKVRFPKAYLFATARNAAIDFYRRQKIVSFEPLVSDDQLTVLDNEPQAAESLSHAQELDILREAIEALPERCRIIMNMRKIQGLPNREIAGRLGLSVNTVNVQLVTGLKRCRQYLLARGVRLDTRP